MTAFQTFASQRDSKLTARRAAKTTPTIHRSRGPSSATGPAITHIEADRALALQEKALVMVQATQLQETPRRMLFLMFPVELRSQDGILSLQTRVNG